MLSTISLLWHASGVNKVLPYILLVMGIFAIFAVVYWQGLTKGQANASVKQLNDSLNRYMNDARRKADIESLTTAVARDRLRNRWERR